MESKWNRARAKASGSARQLYLSRLLKSLRTKLGITQARLGDYLGVSRFAIIRWERRDGVFPMKYRWMRIRELWALTKRLDDPKFWEDRLEPPDFSC